MNPKQKKLASSPSEYDPEYDSFIQGLELVGLGMKSCRCELDRGLLFSAKSRVKIFDQKYRVTDVTNNSFDAEGTFELTISESEEKTPAVRMECVFESHFHGASVAKEHCERFAVSELRLILVPMVRQFFFSVSGQMSISPIVLPLSTRFARKQSKKKKEPMPALEATGA